MTLKKTLQDKIDFIVTKTENKFNEKMIRQGKVLVSYHYNITMQYAEEKLKEIYEKTRVLEDIASYAQNMLKNEVVSRKINFLETLKLIEKTRDSTKIKGYISKELSLNESSGYRKVDRDHTVVDGLLNVNQLLSLSHGQILDVKVTGVNIRKELVPFKVTYENLLKNKSAHSFYILEGPATNGVTEHYMFQFEGSPRYLTHVLTETANVDVEAISIENSGNVVAIPGDHNAGFKRTMATSVILSIADKSYRQVTYEYDDSRVSSTFWTSVAEKEYASEMGIEYTFDLEKENGMKKYREDYEQYLKDHQAWVDARIAMEARNDAATSAYNSSYSSYSNEVSAISSSHSSAVRAYENEASRVDKVNNQIKTEYEKKVNDI